MKIRYPIIGYCIVYLLKILNDNLNKTDTWFLLSDILGWSLNICIVLLAYAVIKVIYRAIKAKKEP